MYHGNTENNQTKTNRQNTRWIVTQDKVDFRAENIAKDKEVQFIMIKWLICQEKITILNIYGPDNSFKPHEAKADRTARRNRKTPNYIRYFNLNACHTITEKEVWRLSNPVHSFYCMREMGLKEVH